MNSHAVAARAGITYRQLDYWTRAGHLPAAERLNHLGSGYPREWTAHECQVVVALAQLVRAGVRVAVAARCLREQAPTGQLPEALILPGGVEVRFGAALRVVASA